MASLGQITPVLRIFDERKAREFYVDFLGFTVVFEHRFEPGLPIYMGVTNDGCCLHLSEHHGDACPGASVRIKCDDVKAICEELRSKNYKCSRPGSGSKTPWGTREVSILDPFGNNLTFVEELTQATTSDPARE